VEIDQDMDYGIEQDGQVHVAIIIWLIGGGRRRREE